MDSKYTLRGYLQTIARFLTTLDGYTMNYEKKVILANSIRKVERNIREYLNIDTIRPPNNIKIRIRFNNVRG